MLDKKLRGELAAIVIISLVVGAFGGVLGSFFLRPQLEKTIWGNQFLNSGIIEPAAFDEDSSTIAAVKKVSPSVVSVVVSKTVSANAYNFTGPDPFGLWGFNFRQPLMPAPPAGGSSKKQVVGAGTGFVIGSDGLILTNRHVVEDEAADYAVVFNDEKKYEAKVLARDAVYDIAVLKIDAQNLPVAELGDSDKIEIGQTVIAIGNTLSEYQNTVTRGVISGLSRRITAGDAAGSSEIIDGAIQTDAAINPGNSGGPLLNLSGQVIGINTAINSSGQSIGFAIPINQVKTAIASVKQSGKIIRPWLGVRYVQIDSDFAAENKLKYDYGALVVRGSAAGDFAVSAGGPADKAGIEANDIILEVNGQKIDSGHLLVNEIAKYKPGDEIQLKVFHEDKEESLKVKLEERK
ncbi:MAG: trypsin-like peptidase domain-containing protein [Parcubacteria group bacterium]